MSPGGSRIACMIYSSSSCFLGWICPRGRDRAQHLRTAGWGLDDLYDLDLRELWKGCCLFQCHCPDSSSYVAVQVDGSWWLSYVGRHETQAVAVEALLRVDSLCGTPLYIFAQQLVAVEASI